MEQAQKQNWRLLNGHHPTPSEVLFAVTPYRDERKWRTLFAGRATFCANVAMGMDPECFLEDEKARIPAFSVLPSKAESKVGVFWDGFQAECTVQQAVCHQELALNLAQQLRRFPHRIVPSPIWRIPPQYLALAEDRHVLLGCDPSQNVYHMRGVCAGDGRKLGWRFAGGHIHFALVPEEREPERIRSMVKALDAVAGVPSVAFAQGVDHPIRRKYYGLAGEFRLPPHGLEYRTLSNFWMYHPQAYHLVFDLARFALNIGRTGLNRAFMGDTATVINTINYSDVRAAKDLCKLNAPLYNEWLQQYPPPARDAFWRAIETGFLKTIPNFGTDIKGEWGSLFNVFTQPQWRDMK